MRKAITAMLLLALLVPTQAVYVLAQEPPEQGETPDGETITTDEKPAEEGQPQQAQEPEPVAAQGVEPEPEPIPSVLPNPPENDPWLNLKGLQDLFTGEARFNVPFALPPGRRSLTPELSLSYSSFKKDLLSPFGYGFDLSVSSIFRTALHGIDQMYARNDYAVRLGGKYNELALVDPASGLYMGKLGNDMSRYILGADGWTVRDAQGTTYHFGRDEASRQEDPDDPDRVFQWMLTRVVDPNGNAIEYTYFKDRNQIYLVAIEYVFLGESLPLYRIDLNYVPKPTAATSYQTGFAVATYQLLDTINVQEYVAESWVIRRSYALTYDSAARPISRLISVISQAGAQTLPALEFTYYTTGPAIGLLQSIRNNMGGEIDLEYLPSTAYRDQAGQPNLLPFIVQTLHQITQTDHVAGTSSVRVFTYHGGHYFYDFANVFTREYAGFHEVAATDDFGTTRTFFHQSQFSRDNPESALRGEFEDHISKKGRAYREEVYDNDGKLLRSTVTKWSHRDLGNDRYLVLRDRVTTFAWDGNSSHRDTAEEFAYDQYGNVIQHTAWGEVNADPGTGVFSDMGNDRVSYRLAYAVNEEANILTFLSAETVFDQDSATRLKEARYHYDELPLGQVAKGNLTNREQWLNTEGTYLATTYTYNAQGLVTSKTDPKGNTTSYEYDGPILYPAAITNPLGQVTSYTYDYASGQVKRITDPNGIVVEHSYDGFGRLAAVQISNLEQSPTLITRKEITYHDAATPRFVVTSERLVEDAPPRETYEYYDGLGRLVQARTSADRPDQYVVATLAYDARGRVSREYLPFFDASKDFQFTSQPDTQARIYAYDALDRVVTITTTVGKTVNEYDRWTVQTTDPAGRLKGYHHDAYQRLVRVDEHIRGEVYLTTYRWDALGNLIRVTDAEGNVRQFTDDSLGRQLTNELPHRPEVEAAVYTYEYDANGNRVKEVQPDGDIVLWTYDALDRVLTIDDPATPEIEVRYTYDTAPFGIGMVAKIETASVVKEFRYNMQGRVIEERLTIAHPDRQLCGDQNADGAVNVFDVVIYLQMAMGLVERDAKGDLNDDGYMNIFDAILALQHVVGLVLELECKPL